MWRSPRAPTTEAIAHPPLSGLDGWLQSDVTSLEELRGRVVIVHFWTFGCHNCTATIPHLRQLHQNWSREHLEIVGVHAPEFDHEADVDTITRAATRLGVTWPIALDTRRENFHRWQPGRTAYWPRTFVLDRAGRVRLDHIGEGAYDEIRELVAILVAS